MNASQTEPEAALEVREMPDTYHNFDSYYNLEDQTHLIDLPELYCNGPELSQLILNRSELD